MKTRQTDVSIAQTGKKLPGFSKLSTLIVKALGFSVKGNLKENTKTDLTSRNVFPAASAHCPPAICDALFPRFPRFSVAAVNKR
jgi:hypothetical protein